MKTRPAWLTTFAVTMVLALVAAACGSDGDNGGSTTGGANGSDNSPWKFGAVYPLTGSVAGFGVQQSNGLKIAAKLINEDGGVNGHPVEIDLVDGTTSEAVVSATQRLVDSGRPLVFGTASSGFSLAGSPVAERAKVVYVETGATATELTERGFQYYFRTRSNFAIYSKASVDLANDVVAEKLGKSPKDLTAVILHDDGPTGTDIAKNVPIAAKAAGSPNIVSADGYSPTDTKDFTSIILKYKRLQPDVIFWMAFPADAILFWRQAKQLDYTPPSAIAYLSGPGTPDFQKAIGPQDSNGILVLDAPLNIGGGITDEAKAVKDRFEKAYAADYPGESFTGNAVVGFIGGWMMFKYVLPKVKELNADNIRKAMRETQLDKGSVFTGWGIDFDQKGQNQAAFPVALEWQDGKLVTVWPDEYAVGPPKHLPIP